MANAQMLAPIEQAPDMKEKIIRSAIQLFTKKGYAATSVREIVEASGVSKPVLYYYFKNKEELYLQIMHEAGAQHTALVEEISAMPGTARERLGRLFDRTMRLFIAHIDIVRVLHSIHYGPPQGAPEFDHHSFHNKFRELVTQLVAEGIAGGELRKGNIADYTWIFTGLINICFETNLCHPEIAPKPEDLQRMLGTVWDGLAAKPATTTDEYYG